jgi:CrcB protein
MTNLLWVFLGGGLGSIARYGIGDLLKSQSLVFPWGTLLANAVSCIILGYLLAYNLKTPLSPSYRLLLMTGFCGGFSTFSTFSSETYLLLQDGKYNLALAYVAGSLIVGLLGIILGFRLF